MGSTPPNVQKKLSHINFSIFLVVKNLIFDGIHFVDPKRKYLGQLLVNYWSIIGNIFGIIGIIGNIMAGMAF